MNPNAIIRWKVENGRLLISAASDAAFSMTNAFLAELSFQVQATAPASGSTPIAWDASSTRMNERPAPCSPTARFRCCLQAPPARWLRASAQVCSACYDGTTTRLYPFVNARVTDENGFETIDSVLIGLPDGTELEQTPSPDGMYSLYLTELASFDGGKYSLRAVDDLGLASAVATDSVGPLPAGRPATVFPVDNQTEVTVAPRLRWESFPGAAGYGVLLTERDPADGIGPFLNPANAILYINTAVTLTTELRVPAGLLQPGVEYFWAVAAMDRIADVDHAILSPIQSFTTKPVVVPPPPPPVLTAAPELLDRGYDHLTVAWTTDVLCDTRIYYDSLAAIYSDTVIVAEQATRHIVTIPDIEPQTGYYLKIASRSAAGQEVSVALPRAIYTRAAPDYDPPVFVIAPQVAHVGEDMAVLGWETDEPARATLTLTSVHGDTVIVLDQYIRERAVAVHNLQPGTVYTFSVEVYDALGNGPTVREGQLFRTKALADTKPPRLLLRPVAVADQTSVVVVWTADEPHTAVLNVRTPYGAPVGETYADNPNGVQTARIAGLQPGTVYQFLLTMTDVAGNAKTTRPFAFRTLRALDTTPPSFVRGPMVVYIGDRRVVIAWLTDEPADTYIEVRADGEFVGALSDGRLKRHHRAVLTNLRPGADYDLTIYSSDAAGNVAVFPEEGAGRAARGAGGRASTVTTAPTADVTGPVLTTAPAVATRTASSITLEWSTDEAANSVVHFGELSAARGARGSAADLTESVTLGEYVTEHSVTITGLNSGVSYSYQIGSTDPSGNGETVSEISTVVTLAQEDVTPPVFVEQPSVAAATDSRILLRWTTDEPSDSRVTYTAGSEADVFEVYSSDLVTEHVITLANLASSTAFSLTAESTDLLGNGPVSATIPASTAGQADIMPPALSDLVVRVEDTQAWISWQTNETADAYVEYGSTQSLGRIVSHVDYATEHELVLTNLSPSSQYYYRISSTDPTGNSSTTAVVSLITSSVPDTDPPSQVQGLVAESGATEVRLTWNENSEVDLAGYNVERAAAGGAFSTIASLVRLPGFLDVGVQPGTSYSYRVSAEDKAIARNIGSPSATAAAAPSLTNAPAQPAAVPFTETVSSQPRLVTTNAVANSRSVAGYTYILASDEALTQIVATAADEPEGQGSSAWKVPFRLEHEATYWWAVKAVDEAGFAGPWSAVSSFAVDTSKVVSAQMISFTAEGVRAGVVLRWEVDAPEDSRLRLSRAHSTGEPGIVAEFPAPLDPRMFIDQGAIAGERYVYTLEAVSTSGAVQHLGAVEAVAALPRSVALNGNVPNPFNPVTSISYEIPYQADVRLSVYNVAGQLVRKLVDERREAGFHAAIWDGRTATGEEAASGVYVARLQVREAAPRRAVETRVIRMVMVR